MKPSMAAMANRDDLKALMAENGLRRVDLHRIFEPLGVGRATVNSWLAPKKSVSARNMPDAMLRLLRLELRAQSPLVKRRKSQRAG